MNTSTSCGVVILNDREQLLLCHATGTSRWDLPKGLPDAGESPKQTAVRETWEETSLILDPLELQELGTKDYLPVKQLHLFALRVASDAFDIHNCRCISLFPHRLTAEPTPEVDAYAWVSIPEIPARCGKNLTRVLQDLDWDTLATLPVVRAVQMSPLRKPM